MIITVYELLGKIKDGEIPKHIHLLPYSVNNPTAGRYTYQDGDYLKDGWKNEWLFKERLFKHLNDEIEILEEKKIPEKIDKEEIEISMAIGEQICADKINEIIDYLKSKGE